MIENAFVCRSDYDDVRLLRCCLLYSSLELRAVYFPAFLEHICLQIRRFTFSSDRALR
jgi:hypothetical protein